MERAFASNEVVFFGEYRFRRGDGTYADVFDRCYIVRDSTGRAIRVIGAMTDVTERNRAERAYNTQILNAAADGIFGFE